MQDTLEARLVNAFKIRDIQPGGVIPTEEALAKELNVGRPALREGLRALEALGVVEGRQGARRVLRAFDLGLFVRQVTGSIAPKADEIRELLDVRRVLEVSFFPQAMDKFTPDAVLRLRELTNQMVIKAGKGEIFLQEDAEFHKEIFRHLDNRALNGLLDAFWILFEDSFSEINTGRNLPETARCHVRIVDAIEADDKVLATHQLSSHFLDVRARLRRQSNKSS